MDQYRFYLWFLAIPFVCLSVMYIVLTIANACRNTTGEIKFILPPDILLKVFAVFMLVSVMFVLTVMKYIQETTASALLGSIASGAIGIVVTYKREGNTKQN